MIRNKRWLMKVEVEYSSQPVPEHERCEGDDVLAAERKWIKDMIPSLIPGEHVKIRKLSLSRIKLKK